MDPNRRYRPPEEFWKNPETGYTLLPFRFQPIDAAREVLVSEVGDFLVCPRGTATRIASREVAQDEELYADLLASQLIADSSHLPLLDVAATRYRTKKSFLDMYTSLHMFVVTLRCNHTCHYCQVSRQTEDRAGYDMSHEDIEFALAHTFRSTAQHITIEFQGGEPLVAFDLVQRIVERALQINENTGKSLTFVLCTNLADVSDEHLAFCRNNNILISTSLDGPVFVHDDNRMFTRGSSYESTIRGIEKARATLGHDRVSALMTTTRLSLQHPVEIVDTYRDLGFDHVFLRPLSPYGFAAKSAPKNNYSIAEFLTFYKAALRHILSVNRKGEHFVEDYASIILKKILTPFPTTYVDLQSPAGLINDSVVFNYDGYVYASDESRMLAETGDTTFQLGHVSEPYEDVFLGDVAQTVADNWSNEGLAGCSDCGFQSYCGADPVYHHSTQGDMAGHRPSSGYCQKNMEIIRFLFELMEESEDNGRIFRDWTR